MFNNDGASSESWICTPAPKVRGGMIIEIRGTKLQEVLCQRIMQADAVHLEELAFKILGRRIMYTGCYDSDPAYHIHLAEGEVLDGECHLAQD